jgi:predicted DNA-binding ArsR family transcriptional regulator
VESFVLRFVNDAPENGADSVRQWHAVVVHVQSNEEKTFSDFADAVAFISRYVQIGEFSFKAEV